MGVRKEKTMLCEYGCNEEAIHQFSNGKWCCSEKWQSCPGHIERLKKKMTGENNPIFGKKHSPRTKNKIRMKALGRTPWNKGIPRKKSTKKILSEKLKGREPWNKGKKAYSCRRTIKQINDRYPFFSMIEEMRYNPNKKIKEIQVRCKNHKCLNSKEMDGWFTPTSRQIELRVRALENEGQDLSYFYCSDECKDECPLFNLHPSLISNQRKYYTSEEYEEFRNFVLKRDNYICQFCGEDGIIVHHERPQKIEPFFALDPDFAWSCCEKCHYEKGHKKGSACSTGNLANVMCI